MVTEADRGCLGKIAVDFTGRTFNIPHPASFFGPQKPPARPALEAYINQDGLHISSGGGSALDPVLRLLEGPRCHRFSEIEIQLFSYSDFADTSLPILRNLEANHYSGDLRIAFCDGAYSQLEPAARAAKRLDAFCLLESLGIPFSLEDFNGLISSEADLPHLERLKAIKGLEGPVSLYLPPMNTVVFKDVFRGLSGLRGLFIDLPDQTSFKLPDHIHAFRQLEQLHLNWEFGADVGSLEPLSSLHSLFVLNVSVCKPSELPALYASLPHLTNLTDLSLGLRVTSLAQLSALQPLPCHTSLKQLSLRMEVDTTSIPIEGETEPVLRIFSEGMRDLEALEILLHRGDSDDWEGPPPVPANPPPISLLLDPSLETLTSLMYLDLESHLNLGEGRLFLRIRLPESLSRLTNLVGYYIQGLDESDEAWRLQNVAPPHMDRACMKRQEQGKIRAACIVSCAVFESSWRGFDGTTLIRSNLYRTLRIPPPLAKRRRSPLFYVQAFRPSGRGGGPTTSRVGAACGGG